MKRVFYWSVSIILLLIVLSASITCTTTGTRASLSLISYLYPSLNLKTVSGRWISQLSIEQVTYQKNNMTIAIHDLRLWTHGLFLVQKPEVKAESLIIRISAPPSHQNNPKQKSAQKLQLSPVIKKLFALPQWQSIRIQSFELDNGSQITRAKNLYSQHLAQRISLSLDVWDSHVTACLSAQAHSEAIAFELKTRGKIQSKLSAVGNISKLDIKGWGHYLKHHYKLNGKLSLTPAIKLKLNSQITVNTSHDQLKINQSWDLLQKSQQWQWHVEGDAYGSLLQYPLTASLQWGNLSHKHLYLDWALGKASVSLQGTDYLFDIKLPHLNRLDPRLSGLQTGVTIHGHGQLSNLQGNIVLNKGKISLDTEQFVMLSSSVMKWHYNPRQAQISGQLLADGFPISIDLHLPFLFHQSMVQQTIKLKASTRSSQLSLLKSLLPPIKPIKGNLSALLVANGPIRKPTWQVAVTLENASLKIPELGLMLDPVSLEARGDQQKLKIQGKITSGKGQAKIDGQCHIKTADNWQCDLSAGGEKLTIVDTHTYKIVASPKVGLLLSATECHLSGETLINQASIRPVNLSNTFVLPSDVTIHQKNRIEKSDDIPFTYDLKLLLGDHVKVNSHGLRASLQGNLLLRYDGQRSDQAQGQILIKNGSYILYGQRLKITKGQLNYSGGSVDNPNIDFQASRTLSYRATTSSNDSESLDVNQARINDFDNDITVGINVTGTLKSPKTQLFSVPGTLNQADILSLLLLGQPATAVSGSTDNASQKQLLFSALNQLKLGVGSSGRKLTKQLKHALNISRIGIENQQLYDAKNNTITENTALVIGQSLTSRLSLQYSIGLVQPINIVRIAYRLTHHWSIQTETSGNANGIDVIYHGSSSTNP